MSVNADNSTHCCDINHVYHSGAVEVCVLNYNQQTFYYGLVEVQCRYSNQVIIRFTCITDLLYKLDATEKH